MRAADKSATAMSLQQIPPVAPTCMKCTVSHSGTSYLEEEVPVPWRIAVQVADSAVCGTPLHISKSCMRPTGTRRNALKAVLTPEHTAVASTTQPKHHQVWLVKLQQFRSISCSNCGFTWAAPLPTLMPIACKPTPSSVDDDRGPSGIVKGCASI